MKNIEIYGSGCDKYFQLVTNISEMLRQKKIEIRLKEITNPKEVAKKGFINLPTLVVDGKIVSQGKSLTIEQLEKIIVS